MYKKKLFPFFSNMKNQRRSFHPIYSSKSLESKAPKAFINSFNFKRNENYYLPKNINKFLESSLNNLTLRFKNSNSKNKNINFNNKESKEKSESQKSKVRLDKFIFNKSNSNLLKKTRNKSSNENINKYLNNQTVVSNTDLNNFYKLKNDINIYLNKNNHYHKEKSNLKYSIESLNGLNSTLENCIFVSSEPSICKTAENFFFENSNNLKKKDVSKILFKCLENENKIKTIKKYSEVNNPHLKITNSFKPNYQITKNKKISIDLPCILQNDGYSKSKCKSKNNEIFTKIENLNFSNNDRLNKLISSNFNNTYNNIYLNKYLIHKNNLKNDNKLFYQNNINTLNNYTRKVSRSYEEKNGKNLLKNNHKNSKFKSLNKNPQKESLYPKNNNFILNNGNKNYKLNYKFLFKQKNSDNTNNIYANSYIHTSSNLSSNNHFIETKFTNNINNSFYMCTTNNLNNLGYKNNNSDIKKLTKSPKFNKSLKLSPKKGQKLNNKKE